MARLVPVDDAPAAAEAPQVAVPARSGLDELVRQFGLTTRYGMEGLGDNVLGFLSSPIRGAMNLAGAGASPTPFAGLADRIGLPKPENATERVVGDVSRGMAGATGMAGAARTAAQGVTGAARGVMEGLASRPGMQMTSGASAGAAGGSAREEGASPVGQFLAAVAGGVAPAAGLAAAQGIRSSLAPMVSRPGPARVDIRIEQALSQPTESGLSWRNLEPGVQARIREQVARAMSDGSELSDAAIRRLADYTALDMRPLRSSLTLDPVDVTRERNLAKIGAASNNPDLQQLARRQNVNNARMVEVLNETGARNAPDAIAAGEGVIGSIRARDTAWAAQNQRLYDALEQATGKTVELDRTYFTNKAFENLQKSLRSSYLPDDVRAWLNTISLGKGAVNGKPYDVPFNVSVIDEYKTVLADAMAANKNNGNARKAIAAVRSALDETPILEPRTHFPPAGGAPPVGSPEEAAAQQTMRLADEARAAHRARMQWQESHPAIRDIVSGDATPDSFMRDYVVGTGDSASVNSLRRLREIIGDDPAAVQQVRDFMVRWIKERATNGAADEVAKVSQAGLNKALAQIGERKLAMFFDPREIAQLQRLGRVSSYEMFQPAGSAVNNPNSGTTAVAKGLDFLTDNALLRRFPAVGPLIQGPARPFQNSISASFSQDLPAALRMPRGPRPPMPLPLGLLGFSPSDQ